MRYLAVAADYDGTLASEGIVDGDTIAALSRLRHSGRRLILITGRQLEDLLQVFPHVELADRIVAENGAVVFRTSDGHLEIRGDTPPERFITALRARGVAPLSIGRVIAATQERHEGLVRDAIRDLALDLRVILNKGAMMILPRDVNKATGLEMALAELHLSPYNTVGVGDAENDEAFLEMCGYSVAVANALPALKQRADWVTSAPRGHGVIELIDRLIESDLKDVPPKPARH